MRKRTTSAQELPWLKLLPKEERAEFLAQAGAMIKAGEITGLGAAARRVEGHGGDLCRSCPVRQADGPRRRRRPLTMPSRRNDRGRPPAHPEGYAAWFPNNESADGWEDFVRAAPAALWAAWQVLIRHPASRRPRTGTTSCTEKLSSDDQWPGFRSVAIRSHFWAAGSGSVSTSQSAPWLKEASIGHPKET